MSKSKKSTAKASTVDERGFDINEKYQQKSDLEHVLLRPDTYVGGLDSVEKDEWICNLEKLHSP